MNNNTKTILKAYDYLEKAVPTDIDCGLLCDKKCCKGSNKDGMLLFPGESELFLNNKNFHVYYDEKYKSYAVTCTGYCDRKQRPLSCRIFPYLFYSNDLDKIIINKDIRAIDYCPLLKNQIKISKTFLRQLRICALLFSCNDEIKNYIKHLTQILFDCNGLI